MWESLSAANKRASIKKALELNETMDSWAATTIRRIEFPDEGIQKESGMPHWMRLTAVGMTRSFF